jgi:acetyl-CoA synthetase
MSYPYQIKSFKEYQETYQKSIEDPIAFWADIAFHFRWRKKWDTVLQFDFKEGKTSWFDGATLNITENCIDRWAEETPHAIAILWESNEPSEPSRRITYAELLIAVSRFCYVLQKQGVCKGDRICLYMPMVPELAIAVLACARIGAIHSVVFGGFSSQSIRDRIIDAQCKLVITADGVFRGNKCIELKNIIDDALADCDCIAKVIVLERAKNEIQMDASRDVWWHEEVNEFATDEYAFFEPEEMQAEDPLFILYTSGSTGKPKGVVHACAGYMVYTNYSFVNVFQYTQGDIFFCTADIGWITGHSYIIYGPLSAGATTLLFEGIPTYPDAGRFWDIIDYHKVNIFYTAPTAIRSLMSYGLSFVENRKLDSLKVLGSVGEPINEEAWHWFHTNIGKEKCPIVDTWWQTETGGILLSNLAGVTPHKPAHATFPLPGIQPVLMDECGNKIIGSDASLGMMPDEIIQGNLCIQFPWPSILRTTYGDHERCKANYFSTYENNYFTGDGCLRDTEGNYRITGRVDDVLNVSGHRIGTAEVENAIDHCIGIIESAVVGFTHPVKGQGIYAYIICKETIMHQDNMRKQVVQTVQQIIGSIAKPDKIQFVPALPKTRSGKIMRRILRKIADGEVDDFGDTSTLIDPSVVQIISEGRIK